MNRRTLVMAATGVAAAAAGLGWQLSRGPTATTTTAGGPPPDADALAFWESRFPQVDGTELAMSGFRGQPLVLNFWATWCPPCVKEMPELDRFARQFAAQGGKVLGLAVDNPKAVRDFLARTPVGYAIALAGFEGTELSRRLGNPSGALPFTALFDRQGAVRQRKLGETTFDELLGWSRAL